MSFSDYVYEYVVDWVMKYPRLEPNVLYIGEKQFQMMNDAYRELDIKIFLDMYMA